MTTTLVYALRSRDTGRVLDGRYRGVDGFDRAAARLHADARSVGRFRFEVVRVDEDGAGCPRHDR